MKGIHRNSTLLIIENVTLLVNYRPMMRQTPRVLRSLMIIMHFYGKKKNNIKSSTFPRGMLFSSRVIEKRENQRKQQQEMNTGESKVEKRWYR